MTVLPPRLLTEYEIDYYILPKGTILYRSSPEGTICKYKKPWTQKQTCWDTGKEGVYLSTYILQSLGMMLEYKNMGRDVKTMDLGIFKTTAPIKLGFSKYSYTLLHKNRFFNKDGLMKKRLTKKLLKNEKEMSHFNHTLPLFPRRMKIIVNKFLSDSGGEVFLANDSDLKKIKLMETYTFNINDLKRLLKEKMELNGYVSMEDSESIINYPELLKPLKCDKRKTVRKRKEMYI